ncbi:Fibronectin type III domain protein [compost metagenome]
MSVGLILADDPNTVVKVPVPDSGRKTSGWVTKELDLSAYAGRTAAAFGLVFNPGQGAVNNYQMNIGQLRITDGTAVKPAAPAGLTIAKAFRDTNEMVVEWKLDPDYNKVKQYNVYVNDVYMGGKYDEVFYLKRLPAKSGRLKVVAVGADGREGDAATLNFNLNAAVSNLKVNSQADGKFAVSWSNSGNAAGEITVRVKSVNWITAAEPVQQHTVVPAGSTSAVFTGMPVNGDDYIVTVTAGNADPVSVSGRFLDTIAGPYAEAWSWNQDVLNLPMPNTRDWRYLYVYEDGVAKSFATTYSSGNKPMIVRGRTTKASLSFRSTAKVVYVVMEDYAGNRSESVYLKGSH